MIPLQIPTSNGFNHGFATVLKGMWRSARNVNIPGSKVTGLKRKLEYHLTDSVSWRYLIIWRWVKSRCPKWNPGKVYGPAIFRWCNFDPCPPILKTNARGFKSRSHQSLGLLLNITMEGDGPSFRFGDGGPWQAAGCPLSSHSHLHGAWPGCRRSGWATSTVGRK